MEIIESQEFNNFSQSNESSNSNVNSSILHNKEENNVLKQEIIPSDSDSNSDSPEIIIE